MSAFSGVSITEVIVTFKKLKEVYDTFNDEYDGADNRIKELFETSNLLHDVLEEAEVLLAHWNRTFPAQESFVMKLKELDHFIKKYSTLVPVKPGQEVTSEYPPPKWKRRWQITRFAFDDAEKLKNDLSREMQQLVTFVTFLALRTTILPNSGRRPRPTPAAPTPNAPNINVEFEKLRILNARRDNIMTRAQLGPAPDTSAIDDEIQAVLRAICYKAGLSGIDVPIQLEPRQLLLPSSSSSQSMNDILVNLSGHSIHNAAGYNPRPLSPPPPADSDAHLRPAPLSPRRVSVPIQQRLIQSPPRPQPQLQPSSSRHWQSPPPSPLSPSSTFQPSVTSASPGTYQASFSTQFTSPIMPSDRWSIRTEPAMSVLGQPALAVCRAKIALNKKLPILQLNSWSIFPAHVVVWTAMDGRSTLEHHLPHSAWPYTKHSSLGESPLNLEFLPAEKHKFVVRTDGMPQSYLVYPKYKFVIDKDLEKFQGDVRDKDLLKSFEIDIMKSKRPSTTGVVTSNEVVKLWRTRDYLQARSLSFYAPEDNRHREFPIRWFKDDVTKDQGKLSVQLDFIKRKGSSNDVPGSPKRAGTFFRKKSSSSKSLAEPLGFFRRPSDAPSQHNPRASVSTVSSAGSSSDESGLAPAEIAESFKHLSIVLSSPDHYKTFVKFLDPTQTHSTSVSPPVLRSPFEVEGNYPFEVEGSHPIFEMEDTMVRPTLELDERPVPQTLRRPP
ncbi:hypothetical protein K402DRAFT_424657 [Aulographum hederae CBS 113979]|uniref:Uncharacterized protein n=1 Tax=Aulographum hederae CBS 113979 TaxID=1176131 RepID=A0A6G1GNK1_9PEZI|nr:hypothetical protein K402DRAFT_424657 [Aulographum hederae CBS 113979]